MDLTRLYNLTTPELRDEAERLGVNDTYAMSRGQLIHAIRSRAGSEQPEGLLGKVLGFAKWAIQAAQEEPRKDSGPRWAQAKTPPVEARPEPEPKRFERPMPAIGAEAEAEAGTDADAGAGAGADTVADADADTVAGTVPGTDAAAGTVPVADTDTATGAASGPPSRPPVGVFSKTASIFDEPFPTLTMARILAEQGHFKRALAIYAALLREGSADAALSAEAEDVRARSRARRPQVR